MPLFLCEDEYSKLGKRQLTLPQNLVDHLQQQYNLYSGKEYRQNKGYKRLNSLLNKGYNDPSDKKDRQHNTNHTISFSDAKRIEHDIKNMVQSNNNLEYTMIGGDMMKDWIHSSLSSLRNGVRQVSAVPKVAKLTTKDLKPKDAGKELKVGSAEVTLESFEKRIRKEYKDGRHT